MYSVTKGTTVSRVSKLKPRVCQTFYPLDVSYHDLSFSSASTLRDNRVAIIMSRTIKVPETMSPCRVSSSFSHMILTVSPPIQSPSWIPQDGHLAQSLPQLRLPAPVPLAHDLHPHIAQSTGMVARTSYAPHSCAATRADAGASASAGSGARSSASTSNGGSGRSSATAITDGASRHAGEMGERQRYRCAWAESSSSLMRRGSLAG